MNDFDIPIFKKSYDLYKLFYGYRSTVPKQDRYTIWQRCDSLILDLIENILLASQISKDGKSPILDKASLKLNFLRIFIRLMKETRVIDNKKYVVIQEAVDEIGRMLGVGSGRPERCNRKASSAGCLSNGRHFGRKPEAEPKLSFGLSTRFVSNLTLPSLKLT